MTPEESTTPDLVERSRSAIEAAGRRDFDSAASFYAPDAVWDVSAIGMGVYERVAVIRQELEQWILQMRFASVTVWRGGLIARVTPYPDIDKARAAAERLGQERR